MVSIVVAAPPITGETLPLLQLAHGLVRRGHEVTAVVGSRYAREVAGTGARHVPLTGAADFDDRRIDEVFPERRGLAPGPEQLNHTFSRFSGDGIPESHRILQRLLAEDPDRVLVADSVFLGAWPVALGAPGRRFRRWIGVGCNPLGVPSADTTPYGPVPPGPDGDAAAANLAANRDIQRALEPSRRHIEGIVRDLGAAGEVPAFMAGIVTLPDVFCALTVPELEFERSDAPSTLRFVGPLPVARPSSWREPSWWGELDRDVPVVVVTQGTLDNGDLTELVRPTLDALAGEDLLVVAALGRDVADLPGTVPDDAHIEPFVPFDALLPRVDVLVTNGGFGGTQLALASGTPVVLAGTTEDKPLVAARVTAHGLGVDLATATPSPDQVRDAVRAVLADRAMHARVEAIAQAYRRYDAVEAIADLVEDLPGAPASG